MATKLNPKIEVRDSPIEGKGLFAIGAFKKGEEVWVPQDRSSTKSKVMNDGEFKKFMEKCKREGKQWDAVYLGNGLHRAAIANRNNNPSNYGNHSCDPNTAPIDGKRIATRDIEPGKEITIDYGFFSPKDWEMKCNCNSPNCRGTVRGYL